MLTITMVRHFGGILRYGDQPDMWYQRRQARIFCVRAPSLSSWLNAVDEDRRCRFSAFTIWSHTLCAEWNTSRFSPRESTNTPQTVNRRQRQAAERVGFEPPTLEGDPPAGTWS